MRAKMKNGLVKRYREFFASEVDPVDTDVELLLNRIEGKVVELTFTCGDAFEENDNNIWLPDCLWEEVIWKE